MNYNDLLKKYIEESGLSLSEIEERMREKGFATNKAYISRLQNGKIPPAGDDINKALAEVVGGDANELIIQANIDKSPILRELIETIMNSFVDSLKKNKEFLLSLAITDPEYSQKNLKNTQEILSEEDSLDSLFNLIPFKMKITFIITMFQALTNHRFDQAQNKMVLEKISDTKNNFFEKAGLNQTKPSVNDVADYIDEDEMDYLRKCLETYRELRLKPSKGKQ